MRVSPWLIASAAALALVACKPDGPQKPLADMSPEEVEALSNSLQAACRQKGIDPAMRAFDDCVRDEAKRRGLI